MGERRIGIEKVTDNVKPQVRGCFFLHAKEVEFRFSMSKPSRFVSRQKYMRVLLVACEAHDERCCKTREIHGNRSIVIIEE